MTSIVDVTPTVRWQSEDGLGSNWLYTLSLKGVFCDFLKKKSYVYILVFDWSIWPFFASLKYSLGRTSGKSSPFSPLCRAYRLARLATHMRTLYFRQFSPLRDEMWRQPDQVNGMLAIESESKQELSLKKTTQFGGAITVCELPDVLGLHNAAYSKKKKDTKPAVFEDSNILMCQYVLYKVKCSIKRNNYCNLFMWCN